MSINQSDRRNLITGVTTLLKDCFNENEIWNQKLLVILDQVLVIVSESADIYWNKELEELMLTVKLCIVYNDTNFIKLFNYNVVPDYTRESIQIWHSRGITLCKKACQVIQAVSEKIRDNYCYRLLYIMVEAPNPRSFPLSDLFKVCPADEKIEISPFVSYSSLIPVIRFLVFRSKVTLASAESRKTSTTMFKCQDVRFTSLSTEMADVLKVLLALGLKICNYRFIKTQPELNLEVVQNFTFEVASACPFERLDPEVFEMLSRYISVFHSSRPKLCSRIAFTTLCNTVMKCDPDLTGNLACLLTEKPLYNLGGKTKHVNSVLVDCYRSITVWITAIHLNSLYISTHCTTAASELKLLSGLCKTNGFSDTIFKYSTLLLKLIVSILRAANVLEVNLVQGSYGVETSQRSEIAIKMAPVIEATNLLALLVKLCSQKTAEESCCGSWEVEDLRLEHSPFSEFVGLWSTILDIFPTLMKSQVTSIPMGVLNAVAEFGETLFALLQETPLQRAIITTVLVYCSKSVKADIRAKAGRALARLIEFESLSEELNFSMDTFDAIKTNMAASELSVRGSFSWAFGNWSDIYLPNYVTPGDQESILVMDQLITDFHLIIKNSHEDKAKVKYNVYRAAGNLLRSLQYVDPKNVPKIKDVIFVLIDQVGKGFDFKARWNASYALRTVFTNEIVFTQLGEDVVSRTMQCFMKHMCQSENFKERAQCVIGVASLTSREHYGPYYMTLWGKLITAATRGPLDFFGEVGPADKLNMEVGRAYIHLIAFLGRKDLENLWETIESKWENIEFVIKFSLSNMPSDDSYPLRAAKNLDKLYKYRLRPFELETCNKLLNVLQRTQFRLESRER